MIPGVVLLQFMMMVGVVLMAIFAAFWAMRFISPRERQSSLLSDFRRLVTGRLEETRKFGLHM